MEKDYSEWHKIEYKGKKYIFNPFFSGVGAWFELTETGKPGKGSTIQKELNSYFFGRQELPSLYERFSKASPQQKEKLKSQSMSWLNLKVKALKQNEANLDKILNTYNKKFFRGGLFFYTYDAKHKDRLPYWDKFPLILLLEIQGSHFLGANLHYLDNDTRLSIISELSKSAVFDKNGNVLISNTTYSTIKNASKLKPLKELCIKKYIKTNVQGKILPVEAHEWIFAAMLPVADFQKKSNYQVRKISKKRYSK